MHIKMNKGKYLLDNFLGAVEMTPQLRTHMDPGQNQSLVASMHLVGHNYL